MSVATSYGAITKCATGTHRNKLNEMSKTSFTFKENDVKHMRIHDYYISNNR